MKWQAEAASNLAFIKYMGKEAGNVGMNPSLSYTLTSLVCRVELEEAEIDSWQALQEPGFENPNLSSSGQQRFLEHLSRVKGQLGINKNYLIKSANNFPGHCGVASSAASFAALTKATFKAAGVNDLAQMGNLSRQGSGSSCRSFFAPWALWQDKTVEPVELPYKDLLHQLVVVSRCKKAVSSSEAHHRVQSSLLFKGRVERAELRLGQLLKALKSEDWRGVFEICWQETFDMHALFFTSQPPFSYMSDESLYVLQCVYEFWSDEGDGPVASMDAGANVHLLYRPDQGKQADQMAQRLTTRFELLSAWQNRGDRIDS